MQIVLLRGKTDQTQSLRDELMSNPQIENICFAGSSPVHLPPIFASEGWTWKGLPEGSHTSIYSISVDHNYLTIFQIPLIEGRFFSSSKSRIISLGLVITKFHILAPLQGRSCVPRLLS